MNDSLYADPIMELARQKIDQKELDDPQAAATSDNPLCGDRISIEIKLNDSDEILTHVSHKVRGCALCTAAANLIANEFPGRQLKDIRDAESTLESLLKQNIDPANSTWACLNVFHPVQKHKSRHECVLLPFRALEKALRKLEDTSNSPD